MTESVFQAKLLRALRQHPALKDAVIFKHSDMVNGGIPDISITVRGNTNWFELKVAPNKLSRLQEHYLEKLGPRAFLVTQFPDRIVIGILSYVDLKAAVQHIAELCLV